MSATVASAAANTLPGDTLPGDALPNWLCQQWVLGTLPWAEAIPYSEFCDRYTLCDSQWLGLFQQTDSAVACIRWDLLWLPDALFNQVDQADAVYVFLKFDQVLGLAVTNGSESPETPTIVQVELEPVDDQQVLLLEESGGRSTTVVFAGAASCVAIAAHNQIIQL